MQDILGTKIDIIVRCRGIDLERAQMINDLIRDCFKVAFEQRAITQVKHHGKFAFDVFVDRRCQLAGHLLGRLVPDKSHGLHFRQALHDFRLPQQRRQHRVRRLNDKYFFQLGQIFTCVFHRMAQTHAENHQRLRLPVHALKHFLHFSFRVVNAMQKTTRLFFFHHKVQRSAVSALHRHCKQRGLRGSRLGKTAQLLLKRSGFTGRGIFKRQCFRRFHAIDLLSSGFNSKCNTSATSR